MSVIEAVVLPIVSCLVLIRCWRLVRDLAEG
jgi:hypothetical protein